MAILRCIARHDRFFTKVIMLLCLAIAVAGARPFAGSWNDGSRLAAVEAIADHGTLAIDESVFVTVPAAAGVSAPSPYPVDDANLMQFGTKDKLRIDGRYYSEKPAVISILMATFYQICQWLGLPAAAERPDLFAWLLTVVFSGLSYGLALWSLDQLGKRLELSGETRVLWLSSIALATVALTYTRHVNNHIMFLGVASFLILQLHILAQESTQGRRSVARLLCIGSLAGLAYNLDLAAGPVLVLSLVPLVAYHGGRSLAVGHFLVAALPWIVACHAFNYSIGGVLKPINMVPEYAAWPGSPFSEANLTGLVQRSAWKTAVYCLALLYGKHGFLGHNLPLLTCLPALALLARWREREWPLLAALFGWCAGTWLMYGVLSNNYGGGCVSIRWFVPLLAPGFYLIALYLKSNPSALPYFCIISFWGLCLSVPMWLQGPWTTRIVPILWPVQFGALFSILGLRWLLRTRTGAFPAEPQPAQDWQEAA